MVRCCANATNVPITIILAKIEEKVFKAVNPLKQKIIKTYIKIPMSNREKSNFSVNKFYEFFLKNNN